jgi:predicted MFS family arabinose efflux permease
MQLTEFNLQYMCIGIALIIVCACGLGITAIPIVWQEMKSQPSVEAALALAFAVFHVASVAGSFL